MKKVPLLVLFFIGFLCSWQLSDAQSGSDPSQPPPTSAFRPSIAVVIGILSIMFSLTFLLLLYAKFCHAAASEAFANGAGAGDGAGGVGGSRFSGIDKTVIESLPLFRFSSLKGSKEGLECAVCLSKFDDAEVLRLLPKCKHAFHLDCVDRWLESHSSCPLCRYKVDAGDLTTFAYSNSLRFPGRDIPPPDEPPRTLELFVEREPNADVGDPSIAGDSASTSSSAKFSFMGSFRKQGKGKKEEGLIQRQPPELHRFKHQIFVSDVMLQGRWSDVNSSDLLLLSSEMLNSDSSRRMSAPVGYSASERYTAKPVAAGENNVNLDIPTLKQEIQRKIAIENRAGSISRSLSSSGIPPTSSTSDQTNAQMSTGLINPSSEKRSMSDITNFSRFGTLLRSREAATSDGGGSGKEERLRRMWPTIAKRTVKWFAGREKREHSGDRDRAATRHDLNV